MAEVKCARCGKPIIHPVAWHITCWDLVVDSIARRFCEEYCKFPDECKTQEELDEHCDNCEFTKLAKLKVENEVRKQKIYIVTDARYNGDRFMEYFFTEGDALAGARKQYQYMVADERYRSHLYINGAEVTLPEGYELTTAKKLMMDLIGGWIECPEYDAENCEFAAAAVIFSVDFWRGELWK